MAAMGVQFFGEEYYNTKILVHEGVPPAAIHVLEPPILNTADEIVAIKAALNTAPENTAHRDHCHQQAAHPPGPYPVARAYPRRRPRHRARAFAGHFRFRALVAQLRSDALDVVREVLGLMNAWAGLPLGQA